jgi:ABC-2 type transport system permease protein
MSTTTATRVAARPATTDIRVTFPRLVRSEWIKLWTVRSTWWVVPIAILAQTGFAWLIAYFGTQSSGPDGPGDFTADYLVMGIQFSQLAVCVLAVLTLTGEYSTGMIRSTLTSAPKRLPALHAKGLVILAVSFAIGVVAAVLSWLVTYPVLGDTYRLDLGDATNQRVLLGAPLYMVGIAVLAYAIGALLRHSAAALATVLGLLLVITPLFAGLPVQFLREIAPFLPSNAGLRVLDDSTESIEALRAASDVAVLTPWQGFGVLIAWGLLALGVAAVLLRRRDA